MWSGDVRYDTKCIRLAVGMGRAELEETFLHELIHICNKNLKESTVENLSQNLYATFRENNLIS